MAYHAAGQHLTDFVEVAVQHVCTDYIGRAMHGLFGRAQNLRWYPPQMNAQIYLHMLGLVY